ncbi:hypothetical protein [Burkholderia lata]|uniref:hypothetical protein n=1 Tax=Burkholderia lata (strain ATCC 17760 / DSM 23089 / LMG 22485 / NCIMB 9086 / R18194 / 383) TaxID=482957 RepID=UPI001584282D|nr:hypothetical protein [Burkholderia lata]
MAAMYRFVIRTEHTSVCSIIFPHLDVTSEQTQVGFYLPRQSDFIYFREARIAVFASAIDRQQDVIGCLIGRF